MLPLSLLGPVYSVQIHRDGVAYPHMALADSLRSMCPR